MIARAAALGLLVVVAATFAVLRDDGEDTVFVHRGDPVFNVLYDDALIEPVEAPGALAAFRGERKGLVATLTVRPLRLPAYEGDVAGLLPVFADNFARGRRVTVDARARIHGAPGYEIGFELPDGSGTLLFLVPADEPGARDGVVLELEQRQPASRDQGGGRSVALAMRSALRSFQFGSDRD